MHWRWHGQRCWCSSGVPTVLYRRVRIEERTGVIKVMCACAQSITARQLINGCLGPCLDHLKIPSFFTLSITSIFSRLHGVLNVGKKISNYTV
jgi:hypothetical protein